MEGLRLIVDFFTTDIGVQRKHWRMIVSYCSCFISIVFKDVMDKSVAVTGNLESNPTTGFESVGSILFLKPKDAKTGIKKDLSHRVIVDQFEQLAEPSVSLRLLVDW
jgi:hypothetical protein